MTSGPSTLSFHHQAEWEWSLVMMQDSSSAQLFGSVRCNVTHSLREQRLLVIQRCLIHNDLGTGTLTNGHTLIASCLSCSESPLSMRLCISSMIIGRLRPFTNTLEPMLEFPFHISQRVEKANYVKKGCHVRTHILSPEISARRRCSIQLDVPLLQCHLDSTGPVLDDSVRSQPSSHLNVDGRPG